LGIVVERIDRVSALSSVIGGPTTQVGAETSLPPGNTLVERLLDRLSILLPPAARKRFVAEVMGDLWTCESRWERISRLLNVATTLPGLATMMRRENRRDRA
jgi:hypothetical protein